MKCTKIIALMIVVLVSLSLGSLALVTTASSQVLWGDVDGDGNFNSNDYALMRQCLLGMISKESVAATADVDGDGKLTSDDYAYMKRHLLGMISVFPVEESMITPTPTADIKGSLTMSFNKNHADQGDIIIASLNIKDIKDFAGYQVNIKYDATVLQPIIPFGDDYLPYGNLTPAEPGTLLAKEEFKPVDIVFHDTEIGLLSFGRSYLKLDAYKNSGNIETTGSVGIIRFRVLRVIPTKVYFKGTKILPSGIQGTALYDFNANQIMNYDIIQPNTLFSQSDSTPTPTIESTQTPTPTSIPTSIPTATPTSTPTADINGSLTMSFNKNHADQGDIIIASLNIKDIKDFAGYQVNIKYDATVLQPIIPFGDDYLPYGNLTPAEPGTLLAKEEFKPVDIVFHDTEIGLLSFGRSYLKLDAYKNSGNIETTGSVGIIRFRVLRVIPTKVYFKGTKILPSGIQGTALYDFNANQIMNYDIIQPNTLFSQSDSTPTPTIESTPTPTPTSTPTPKLGVFNLVVDKTDAPVGDIITTTLSIKEIPNFSGYQATLKYDPDCLQPVYSDGTPYDKTSAAETGSLLCGRYSPTDLASNDLESGLLNFGRAYMALNTYRNSKAPESSGILAKVHFKVLKPYTKPALVDNSLLDNDIEGTLVFDWNGNIVTDYNVAQY
ncbi:cohesin domain-containing protein [Pseudobacteroides cellulosolvens]|uniref:Cellulosome anchoring protein cohesin region n=2 Tax=Pseudobacteroides cellulosolvens TaxID=35825 RepID=A0A0L6JNR4_9FIRM|nr:cohesin domain-containing protein [Pseudobacteroides cellulosolvens]KNY27012.1 cellulosome anchoring protein cohesin region [Pseudobacteroides cellulosolvens ATCC 35603 = DSM 2933]